MWYSKGSVLECIRPGISYLHFRGYLPLANAIFDRNFATVQVNGVSMSLYNKYATKANAFNAFEAAQRAGHVVQL